MFVSPATLRSFLMADIVKPVTKLNQLGRQLYFRLYENLTLAMKTTPQHPHFDAWHCWFDMASTLQTEKELNQQGEFR